MLKISPVSQQVLLQEALNWLRLNQENLTDDFLNLTSPDDPAYYQHFSPQQRRQGSFTSLNALIERLEGRPFPSQEFKQHYIERFNRGAVLKEVTQRADLLQQVITQRANKDLSDHPQLRDFLINRANYVVQLFKTAIVAGFIEFQANPASSRLA